MLAGVASPVDRALSRRTKPQQVFTELRGDRGHEQAGCDAFPVFCLGQLLCELSPGLLVKMGMPCFGCTPNRLPELLATVLKGNNVDKFAQDARISTE